ncbi:PTS mannose/fructose/sorbose/N-acetylgalactosamine transporter subunit IIC [Helcococcus kunzii]
MLLNAILVGLVGIFCMLDSRLLGRLNFERPLICSTLVGLVLGDLHTGLVVGAQLELVSLGLVNVGAASPPDMVLGSIVASAFAILTKATPEEALTIAIPIAVLGQFMGILLRTIIVGLNHRVDNLIDEGEFKKAANTHIIWGTVLYSLSYFVPIFLAIYLGTDVVKNFISTVPEWLTNGLNLASKIMPAYGFALLLSMMMTKKNVMYMLAGFLLAAYLKLDLTAISLIGIVGALILRDVKFDKLSSVSNKDNQDELDSDDYDILDEPDGY